VASWELKDERREWRGVVGGVEGGLKVGELGELGELVRLLTKEDEFTLLRTARGLLDLRRLLL